MYLLRQPVLLHYMNEALTFFNTYLHRESQIIQDIFHCECTILSGVFLCPLRKI